MAADVRGVMFSSPERAIKPQNLEDYALKLMENDEEEPPETYNYTLVDRKLQ